MSSSCLCIEKERRHSREAYVNTLAGVCLWSRVLLRGSLPLTTRDSQCALVLPRWSLHHLLSQYFGAAVHLLSDLSSLTVNYCLMHVAFYHSPSQVLRDKFSQSHSLCYSGCGRNCISRAPSNHLPARPSSAFPSMLSVLFLGVSSPL